jgi:hypothetical protein
MSGSLSPRARSQLADLVPLVDKVHRAHNLVEQYAAAKVNADHHLMSLVRTLSQLKASFMGAGLDAMSQLAGSMETAARRGMPPSSKTRVLREGVGSLRFQLELAQRSVISDDQAARDKALDAHRTAADAQAPEPTGAPKPTGAQEPTGAPEPTGTQQPDG